MSKLSIYTVTNHWGWSLKGIKTWVKYGWAFFAKWTIEKPSATCYKILFFVLKIRQPKKKTLMSKAIKAIASQHSKKNFLKFVDIFGTIAYYSSYID